MNILRMLQEVQVCSTSRNGLESPGMFKNVQECSIWSRKVLEKPERFKEAKEY